MGFFYSRMLVFVSSYRIQSFSSRISEYRNTRSFHIFTKSYISLSMAWQRKTEFVSPGGARFNCSWHFCVCRPLTQWCQWKSEAAFLTWIVVEHFRPVHARVVHLGCRRYRVWSKSEILLNRQRNGSKSSQSWQWICTQRH